MPRLCRSSQSENRTLERKNSLRMVERLWGRTPPASPITRLHVPLPIPLFFFHVFFNLFFAFYFNLKTSTGMTHFCICSVKAFTNLVRTVRMEYSNKKTLKVTQLEVFFQECRVKRQIKRLL